MVLRLRSNKREVFRLWVHSLLMGSKTSKQKKEDKMVGEDFEVEIVIEKHERKEPEKKNKDEVIHVPASGESESMTEFVDRVCSAVSGPNGAVNMVGIMIHCCVQSILRSEIRQLANEMVAYRNMLSKKMRETPQEELDLQATFNLEKLEESFEAGWRCFKHGCGEDAAFEAFMTTMNIKLPEEEDTTQSQ